MQSLTIEEAFVVDWVDIDENSCLPSLVVFALTQKPLLEDAHFDVTLNAQDLMHLIMLDNQSIDLGVLGRHSWQYLNRLLIEVIVLVLAKLLPPFLAARQGQSLEQLVLAFDEFSIALDTVESVPEHLLIQESDHGAQSYSLHVATHFALLEFYNVARRVIEFFHAIVLVLELALDTLDFGTEVFVGDFEVIDVVVRLLHGKSFGVADVEELRLGFPFTKGVLSSATKHFIQVFAQ